MAVEERTADDASEGRGAMDRRHFVRLLALGGGLGAIGFVGGRLALERFSVLPEDLRLNAPGATRSWVMVIDLDRCDGCGVCTVACQKEHNVPDGQEWIKIYKVQDESGTEYFLPRPCMNCENAPCAAVCPVGATYVRSDGIVLIDHNRCIGCRYCMAACPYNARYFNWGGAAELTLEQQAAYRPEYPVYHRRGTVEKCMFCAHRADEGELPACVQACPMKAIFFGDAREDAVANGSDVWRLSQALKERGGFRFKEELGTKPRVFFLPPQR